MKRLSILFILMIFIAGCCGTAFSFAEDEDDNDDDSSSVSVDTSWFDYKDPKTEYNITSEAQLRGLASLVNEEQALWKTNRVETFEGVTFTLTKDIKLTSDWTPIGRDSTVCFAGIFDGNGHKISGLKIETSSDEVGLFGYLRGEVRNLEVSGSIESSGGNCGSITGELDSSARVSGCTAKVEIEAGKRTGGIVGNNNGGKVEKCINKGDVYGTYKVGGIVGENWGGIIDKCGNEGHVSSSVRGVATFGTGGIAGRSVASTAVISESYNIGDINSAAEATGGVVGYTNAADSTVSDSYSVGNITIVELEEDLELTQAWAGGVVGIVGTDGVIISNCYGAGEINGADVTGGVIGRYIAEETETASTYISNNYYQHDFASVGIGDNKGEDGTDVQNCAVGVTGGTLSGMASTLGISYMKDSSGLYGNDGYPVLRWQEPLSSEDKSYLEGVSKEVQMKLDKYLINNTDATNKGDIVLSIFNPDSYLTDALLLYSEALAEEANDLENESDGTSTESEESAD